MDELSGWRRTFLVMLLLSVAWSGLVAIVASFLGGYVDAHGSWNSAGNIGTVLGGGAALALALRALQRPRRSTLKRVGWGLVALAPALFMADLFALSTCRCGAPVSLSGGVALLQAAIGGLIVSGPILLVLGALLHALERRFGRAGASLPQVIARRKTS